MKCLPLRGVIVAVVLLEQLSAVAVPACLCDHGSCVAGTTDCICEENWEGQTCSNCKPGYSGADCKQECGGGACNECNGHGVCNFGYAGDGSCECDQNTTSNGYWSGPACEDCLVGYFGEECDNACPPHDCHGHGVCNSGRSADGSCLCDEGYDTLVDCSDCVGSQFGPFCSQSCPSPVWNSTSSTFSPCSGHGTCSYGKNGSGSCISCDAGYAGTDCSIQCKCQPTHGICNENVTGDGSCSCLRNRLPPDCTSCEEGYGGPDCTIRCHGIPTCSNFGICDPLTAHCSCSPGHVGDACEYTCPGNVIPCSGHGVCVLAVSVPTCVCDTNWNGSDDCSECTIGMSGHSKTACELPCPNNGTIPVGVNDVCSGHGKCVEGICECNSRWDGPNFEDYCGDSCEGGILANGTMCPTGCSQDGLYGDSCQFVCPGYGTSNGVCSGHGYCDNNGRCQCDPPDSLNNNQYIGSDCSNLVSACNFPFFGAFDPNLNECHCWEGYFGSDCQSTCPKSPSTNFVCSSPHGTCDDGVNGSGKCTCKEGWIGDACEVSCYCPHPGQQCAANGTCECKQHIKNYPNCDTCEDGFHGSECQFVCYGVTVQQECRCDSQHAGSGCNIQCDDCNGNGSCREGPQGDGGCNCFDTWYGTNCDSHCTPTECSVTYNLTHPHCNNETGHCECAARWSGLHCDICAAPYWGIDCLYDCNCSGHGTCGRETGVCSCDPNFAGNECEHCTDEFFGDECNVLRICTTRGGTMNGPRSSVEKIYPPYEMILDSNQGSGIGGYFIAGGNTLSAWAMHRPTDDRTQLLNSAVNSSGISGILRGLYYVPATVVIVMSGTFPAGGSTPSVGVVHMLSPMAVPPKFGTGTPFSVSETFPVSSFPPQQSSLFYHDYAAPKAVIFVWGVVNNVKVLKMSSICFPLHLNSNPCLENVIETDFDEILSIVATEEFLHVVGFVVTANKRHLNVKAYLYDPSSGFKDSGTSCMLPAELTDDPFYELSTNIESHATSLQTTTNGVAFSVTMHQPAVKNKAPVASRSFFISLQSPNDSAPKYLLLSKSEVVSAVACDLLLQACFVALHNGPDSLDAGRILKVSMSLEQSSIFAYDAIDLLFYYQDDGLGDRLSAEVVQSFFIDNPTRTLFALIQSETTTKIASFMLWELQAATPTILDYTGGAVVTVKGKGFANIKNGLQVPRSPLSASTDQPTISSTGVPSCLWGDSQLQTTATIINDTFLTCESPFYPFSVIDGGCNNQKLSITLDGHRSVDCPLHVQRVPSPIVLTATPPSGKQQGGHVITVTGYGFINSPWLSCIFSVGGSRKVLTGTALVTFVNGTEVKCIQPAMPTIGGGLVEVSLDGTVGSIRQTPYNIVGPPDGIAIIEPKGDVFLAGSESIKLPKTLIGIVDADGLIVEADGYSYTSFMSVTSDPVFSLNLRITGTTTASFSTINGTSIATFNDVILVHANASNQFKLVFTYENWNTSLNINIMDSTPSGLLIQTQPSDYASWNATPLAIQPKIVLIDDLGHVVKRASNMTSLTDSVYNITCEVISLLDPIYQTDEIISEFVDVIDLHKDHAAHFGHVSISAAFGARYQLNCSTLIGDEEVFVLSNYINPKRCPSYQYQIIKQPPSERTCSDCPLEALCNGSSSLRTQKGYWRSSSKSPLLKCRVSAACMAGSESGTCSVGYESYLCAVCSKGYYMTTAGSCEDCSAATAILFTVISITLSTIALSAVTCCIFSYADLSESSQQSMTTLGTRLRIVIDHFQNASILSYYASDFWATSVVSFLSFLQFFTGRPAALDCWSRQFGFDIYDLYVGYLSSPLWSLVVALLSYGWVSSNSSKVNLSDQNTGFNYRQMGREGFQKKETFVLLALISLFLMIYGLFIRVLLESCFLLREESITVVEENGVNWTHTTLFWDPRVNPVSEGYAAGSICVIIVLGGGLPFAVNHIHRTSGSRVNPRTNSERAKNYFLSIFSSGIAEDKVLWSSASLLRKVCLVIVASFAPEGKQQLQIAIWIVELYCCALVIIVPYTSIIDNMIEIASNMILIVTLYHGSLMFTSLPSSEYAAVSFSVIALNLMFVVVVGCLSRKELRESLKEKLVRLFKKTFPQYPTDMQLQGTQDDQKSRSDAEEDVDSKASPLLTSCPPSGLLQTTASTLTAPLSSLPSLSIDVTTFKCLYCGNSFNDYQNLMGSCTLSPLTSGMHLADTDLGTQVLL